jgi:hypothetical protein
MARTKKTTRQNSSAKSQKRRTAQKCMPGCSQAKQPHCFRTATVSLREGQRYQAQMQITMKLQNAPYISLRIKKRAKTHEHANIPDQDAALNAICRANRLIQSYRNTIKLPDWRSSSDAAIRSTSGCSLVCREYCVARAVSESLRATVAVIQAHKQGPKAWPNLEPVTPCWKYFLSLAEYHAMRLLCKAALKSLNGPFSYKGLMYLFDGSITM